MTGTLSAIQIQEATSKLIAAKTAYMEASSKLSAARSMKDRMEAKFVSAGLHGKNAEERAANLHLALKDDLAMVEGAEQEVLMSRQRMEVAQLELESLKLQLRLLKAAGPYQQGQADARREAAEQWAYDQRTKHLNE